MYLFQLNKKQVNTLQYLLFGNGYLKVDANTYNAILEYIRENTVTSFLRKGDDWVLPIKAANDKEAQKNFNMLIEKFRLKQADDQSDLKRGLAEVFSLNDTNDSAPKAIRKLFLVQVRNQNEVQEMQSFLDYLQRLSQPDLAPSYSRDKIKAFLDERDKYDKIAFNYKTYSYFLKFV
ncbi:hypothetical protein OAT84_02705 [Gammaproteobacteria bacterium]|nr:hypothetical protein [Gammaproteobacteria bacterium]